MGGAGYATGGPIGGAIAAATDFGLSSAARSGATALQNSRLNTVKRLVSNRPEITEMTTPSAPQKAPALEAPSPMLALPAPGQILNGLSSGYSSFSVNTPQMQKTKDEPLSYNFTEAAPVGKQEPFNDTMAKAFAKAESNNNPNAKNSQSSASGLYQFTNKTWADMVNKYGQQTGIKLSDKNDPKAQQVMVKLLAQDNIQSLQKTIGRMPTLGEVYAAHVFGAGGAAKLINANPNKEAIMLFPRKVLDANRSIFFHGKQPRTVAEVSQILNKKVAS